MSTLRADKKFHRVIREFYDGKLKSNGKKIVDEKQAIAIAFSEARKISPRYKIKKYNNGTKIKIDNTTQLIFDDAWQKYLDYLASPQTQNLLFEQWLQRDPIGLSYNKRLANIMRSEPHAMNEPRMNQRGSKIIGNSHDDGGVPGIIRETQQPIEVEGDELIITKGVAQSDKTVICAGHPEGVASRLNEMHDGNKISNQPGECKEIKMKNGKKIKSHINSSKNERIERMILRDNKLKNTKKMAYGEKIELTPDDKLIKINEEENFSIVCFLKKSNFSNLKVFKSNNICIYKSQENLIQFLDEYGIHYTEFDNEEEFSNWLENQLPNRIKNKIQ